MTELLTPAQAAERLHTTYGTLAVWRCARRRALPFVRIGRKIFYRAEDVDHFILSNVDPGDGPRPLGGRNDKRRRERRAR